MRIATFIALITIGTLAGCRSIETIANRQSHRAQVKGQAHIASEWNVPMRSQGQASPGRLVGFNEDQTIHLVQPTGPQNENTPPPETLPTPPNGRLSQGELSLEDLEHIALRNNPAIAQASAAVAAARGRWTQVGLLPNPVVGYSGQQLGSSGQAEQQGVYLGQEFVMGRKLRLNREAAAWEVQRSERELETMRLRVLSDTRITFYDVLIAQRRRELAEQLVKISDQGVEAAQALFRADEVSEADPLRARVDAAQARIVLQTARNLHLEAWQRLTAIIGMPQWHMQQLSGDLQPSSLELTFDETLHHILTTSPEIAAAMADVEAARWGLRRAQVEAIPNIDVQAVIQDDRGTGSSNGNLQVSVPIPVFNRNQGGISEAQADVIATRRAVDRLNLDLQSRLAAAFQRYQTASNQVRRYSEKGGILENAQKTLDLIRAGYRAEEFGLVDLLTAQRTYFQANLAYLESLRELWVSVMEIKGLLLKNSLPK